MSNKYLRLISDSLIFAIGNFLAKLIQYFLLPFYTSNLTTQVYGTSELLNNLSEILLPIMTFAIYEAVFRFSINNEYNLAALLYESISFLFKILIGSFIIAAAVQYFTHYDYTYNLLILIFASSFRTLFANYARGSGHSKCFAASGIVNALALALFSWLFLSRFQWNVRGYLWAITIAHIISSIVLFYGAGINEKIRQRIHDKQLLPIMLSYSKPLILNNIAWLSISLSNRYIVLFIYGASTAGIYTAASKLPAIISVISLIFQQAWQLNSSREYQKEGVASFFENVWKLYSTIIILFGACIIGATPLLANFTLKKEFIVAKQYIPLMMVSVIINCLAAYFNSLLIAFKQTQAIRNGMMLGAAINLLLSVFLIKPFGIWGILFGNIICFLVLLIHRIYYVEKIKTINLELQANIPLLLLLFIQAGLASCNYYDISIIISILMIIFCIFYYRRQFRKLTPLLSTMFQEFFKKV
ncbi:MAG: polysaccharide biosynthesis C-terminal domain-containing protein [Spirochaetes bacterium]|nr:polysaccharide biosynthesis C-terminal domain-containing protein [Spirochaetota bacterium]